MKLKPPFQMNVPMALTWARIAMIPLVIGIFYLPERWLSAYWVNSIAAIVFVVASVTDALATSGSCRPRWSRWWGSAAATWRSR